MQQVLASSAMSDAPRETPLPDPRAWRPTRADAVLLGLVLLGSGAGSLWLGQDLNFDLLSYHHYNGYAFIFGRLDRDVAAADWHTYINPVMDALGYLGMVMLPPRLFGFLLGAVHGLNVALVYLLSVVVLSDLRHARVLAGLVSLVTALGPNAASLLGTTMGNNVVSIPALAALLALVWLPSDVRSPVAVGWRSSRLLLVGVACGAATGLRLTAAVDLVAVGIAVLLFGAPRRPFRTQVQAFAALCLGGLLGFIATNGAWALRLWERFGNPIFPLANQLFRSPYFDPVYSRDYRFVARDAWDYLRPPLDIALGRMDRFQEIGARDGPLPAARTRAHRLRRARVGSQAPLGRALLDTLDGQRRARVLAHGLSRMGDGVLLLPLHDDARARRTACARGRGASARACPFRLAGRSGGMPVSRCVVTNRILGTWRLAGRLVRPGAAGARPSAGRPGADGRRAHQLRHSRFPRKRPIRPPHVDSRERR